MEFIVLIFVLVLVDALTLYKQNNDRDSDGDCGCVGVLDDFDGIDTPITLILIRRRLVNKCILFTILMFLLILVEQQFTNILGRCNLWTNLMEYIGNLNFDGNKLLKICMAFNVFYFIACR
jgi:hypothetical protein